MQRRLRSAHGPQAPQQRVFVGAAEIKAVGSALEEKELRWLELSELM